MNDRVSPSETPQAAPSVRRHIEVEATPEEVWESLIDEDARDEWLGEPDREILVETADEPRRLVWWWWEGSEAGTRVEVLLVPAVSKTRVVVIESSLVVPLAMLSARFAMVAA